MKQNSITVDMVDVRARLLDLSLTDDPDDRVKQFCRFLSPYITDNLSPDGFVMLCHLKIADLMLGVDGHTGLPIKNGLVGYPAVIYSILHMRIPGIAREVFPSDYADEVCAVYIRGR